MVIISIIELIFILLLGIIAYFTKMLDLGGSLLAICIGLAITFNPKAGFNYMVLLLIFLLLGVITTKYKFDYKERIGVAQRHHGRRGMPAVVGNGLVPVLMSLVGQPAIYVATVAAATADTLATEIGVLSKNDPILITTGRRIKKGFLHHE